MICETHPTIELSQVFLVVLYTQGDSVYDDNNMRIFIPAMMQEKISSLSGL